MGRTAARAVTRLLIAAFMAAVGLAEASAHAVVAAAYVDDATIEGEVGFSNGSMAAGALIDVFTVGGEWILSTTTDEDGFFAFEARRRVDHVIKADLGAGHVAEVVVAAEELPPTLPEPPGAEPVADHGRVDGERLAIAASTGRAVAPAIDEAALRAIVRDVVKEEIRPLQKQILAYESKVRWHDVLGGLGYIIGITGVAAWFLARRRAPAGKP